MAYYAQLQGHEFVHQAISDPKIRELVEALYFKEVGPLLDIPAPFDLREYGQELLARFNNPDLPHRLDQIAMDGSVKVPHRFLGYIEQSATLQLALRAWLHYMWLGLSGAKSYKISDPNTASLKELLSNDYQETVKRWLKSLGWEFSPGVLQGLLEPF